MGWVAPSAYPGLHSGGVSQEVDQELSKMDGARASGEQKSSNWVQGKANKLKQNVKIEYTLLRFSAQNF